MDITRRCDYACRILRSAYRHGDEYVSISEISEEESIPYAFARGIQHDLALAGFLETARGSKGGIRLAVDPATTTMYDVITAVQGDVNMALCSADTGVCDKCDRCDYRRVWLSSERLLKSFYSAITLSELFVLGNDRSADPRHHGPRRRDGRAHAGRDSVKACQEGAYEADAA